MRLEPVLDRLEPSGKASVPGFEDSALILPFDRVSPEGGVTLIDRPIAREVPVALEFDGIGYAVLMATPAALEDLAFGFALTERLIDRAADIIGVEAHANGKGVVLRVALAPGLGARIIERVRHRTSDSSCGLCGIENLDQALRTLPCVTARTRADGPAIFRAQAALRGHQPLNEATGAVHAAAACAADGTIRLVREDVGRHNAFDKLIGAMLCGGIGWEEGFALLSSRCSYELVEKAVLAGCPLLATISAPTDLAVARAAAAGLALRVLVRRDAMLVSGAI